jgi:tetratricopeptide (TPR) repeat protein
VRWLHRTLEAYRLPRRLVGRETPRGPAPRRLTPIFRDRDELPASGDLGGELRGALARSLNLIVVCSPRAARSPWVNEEILTFKRVHGEGPVLALIVAGEPGASAAGGEAEECFPPALRFRLAGDGSLGEAPAHPVAADMRPQGDGQRAALQKLIAGLTGVPLDELVQRETQRRLQTVSALAAGSLAGMALTGGLAVYANELRIEANHQRRVAEREATAARAASDFLVGTFELSNPATENPRTVTALTILNRAAERARVELATQPAIRIRLLDTMGRAYNNLGLYQEARTALEGSRPLTHAVGADGAGALLTLAATYFNQSDLTAAAGAVDEAESLLGPDLSQHAESRGLAAEVRGRIEYAAVRWPAADRDYSRALAFYRQVPDLKPRILARTYANHGLVLSDMGRHDDARASLLQALAIYRRSEGERHLLTGQTYYAMAENEMGAGRVAEAEADISRSIDILRSVLDSDNPILADAYSQRGQILLTAKDAGPARADFQRAIGIYQRAFKGPHYRIGVTEVYLALAESQLNQTASALHELDLAKVQYDASYHRLHVNHGDRLVNRAVILKHAGRIAEAKADCAAGMTILRRLMKPDEAFYKSNVEICAKI